MSEATNSTSTASTALVLEQFPETLAIISLPPGADVPSWVESSSVLSVTATARETSILCAGRGVPTKAKAVRGLVGFALTGDLDPTSTGVLAELLAPLAEEEVTAFVVTTFATAWVLAPKPDAERVAEAWRRRGHEVAPAVPVQP